MIRMFAVIVRTGILFVFFKAATGDTSQLIKSLANVGAAYLILMIFLGYVIYPFLILMKDTEPGKKMIKDYAKDNSPFFSGVAAILNVATCVTIAIAHPFIAVLYALCIIGLKILHHVVISEAS